MPKAILINSGRLNWDSALDLGKLGAVAEVSQNDPDASPEEILKLVDGYDIVISKEIPIPGHVIDQFPPSVRLIQEAGTGFNNVDLAAAKAKGITVCNCPAYSSDAVAQLVLTFILNFSCSMVPQMRSLSKGDHTNFTDRLRVPHFELGGKTLGLIGGTGGIGSEVAKLARACGMNVIFTSRSQTGPDIKPLEELLQISDFVSLHCPFNSETKYIMNKSTLGLMKPTAFLINTGRGPLVNEAELADVLKSNGIAGAALDVQEVEPPPESSPLYGLENVILTPHIGWKRVETRQRLMDIVANNVAKFLEGAPINVVSA